MTKTDDVISTRRFAAADLCGVRFPVGAVSLLALRFFIARHCAPRVDVHVIQT